MSKFTIEAVGEVVVAEFCEDLSPETCAAFKALMPYTTKASFAKMAGDESFLAVPFTFGMENGGVPVMQYVKPGSIVYWPTRPLMCLFHDAPQDEDQNVGLVAQIVENLDGMGKINQAVREHQGVDITFKAIED